LMARAARAGSTFDLFLSPPAICTRTLMGGVDL
jgi:hypothetical protein